MQEILNATEVYKYIRTEPDSPENNVYNRYLSKKIVSPTSNVNKSQTCKLNSEFHKKSSLYPKNF